MGKYRFATFQQGEFRAYCGEDSWEVDKGAVGITYSEPIEISEEDFTLISNGYLRLWDGGHEKSHHFMGEDGELFLISEPNLRVDIEDLKAISLQRLAQEKEIRDQEDASSLEYERKTKREIIEKILADPELRQEVIEALYHG